MKLTVNKKIVSIAFLVLALFMLLAVSYAYFTAQVKGNEEAKEINVTAGIMSVKLSGPDEITAEHLIPGQSVSISFQVENTGTVPAIYNLDMIEVENNFDPTSDLVYTVTSTNNGGHVKDKEAPIKNETLIRNILIQPGEENIQEYTLTLLFKETKTNQDTNQEKTFEGKVQINKLEDKTMATRIIRTTKLQTEEPDFSHASPEIVNDIETDYGKGIFATQDDDGTSYYFRGAVENNNVRFAEMDWKIIRINGDGSIRLILNKYIGSSEYNSIQNDAKYGGYTYDNAHPCTQENPCISNYNGTNFYDNYKNEVTEDSIVKTKLENWYLETLKDYDEYIALTTYCNDTSIIYEYEGNEGIYNRKYGPADRRLTNPTLTCLDPTDYQSTKTHNYGGVYKLKVGLITYDEVAMSGGYYPLATAHYLKNLYPSKVSLSNWTMSPIQSTNMVYMFLFPNVLYNSDQSVRYARSIVPVINLKTDVTFTGDGTEESPYIITNN